MEKCKALCVGINQFKNYPQAALRGCVNDARDMASVLTAYSGLNKSDISVLTNAQATKSNIIKGLKQMVDGAKKGRYTYLVFSMSSHGTQVPDVEGDEADRADEAFCPHDLAQKGDQWHPNHIIKDDELRDLFTQIPPDVLLEVFLDTCHSGTGLKAIDMLLTRQPRWLSPPSLAAFKRMENLPRRGLSHALLDKEFKQHILWAACKDDQTSADALIESKWHGAFTFYYCQELRKAKGNIERKELLELVRSSLAKNDYSQTPQLEYYAGND